MRDQQSLRLILVLKKLTKYFEKLKFHAAKHRIDL